MLDRIIISFPEPEEYWNERVATSMTPTEAAPVAVSYETTYKLVPSVASLFHTPGWEVAYPVSTLETTLKLESSLVMLLVGFAPGAVIV